ncbi:MAG TPA: helix-turn-helix transcriptional regulator [Candidatus Didemnitutus sp.]|nr:helix-turn-helix transcriptional regulator [Candidatus Didemnitutus sp.]
MPRTTPTLFPPATRQLASLGERLRLARLRRRYSAESVAKRAGVARGTLYRVEEGDPGVSIATYASVLRVLGLQGDLDLVARDDVLGRKLQDLNLPTRKTAPRRRSGSEKISSTGASDSIPPAPSSP